MHLVEKALEMGIDMKSLPLRAGVFGAEPWTEAMRKYVQEHTNIKAYDIYGLSEIIGPGVASECECQCGLHIFEDHFYPEIINPETGEVLPDGVEGELVLTTLSQAGDAHASLSHARYHDAGSGAVRLRANDSPHPPDWPPQR